MTNLPNSFQEDILANPNHKSWAEVTKDYVGKGMDSKRNWYSSVADAYNRVRPRYALELISRVIELTQLPPKSNILEIGCGPAIATVSFAELGFSLVSLEPNLEASQLAKQNCAAYPQVKIINTSFEEWEIAKNEFDAVLAATSWHWIDPEIAYCKSFETLKADGYLVLLWNTPPQLDYPTYQIVDRVYQTIAPAVPLYARYEDQVTHQEHFQKFSQDILSSGYFEDLTYESMVKVVQYSLDDYLLLLSTLSPYIALEETTRNNLFAKLREVLYHMLRQDDRDYLTLYYISAFHVARKV